MPAARLWVKAIFWATFLTQFVPVGSALADFRVLAVQSLDIKPYAEAVQGFAQECRLPVDCWVLPDDRPVALEDRLQAIRPNLILAVGNGALAAVKGIERIPIVYMMVLAPDLPAGGAGNITGIEMVVDPRAQVRAMAVALPGIKRFGTLYNPEKTGSLVDQARDEAVVCGIELTAVPVSRVQDVPLKARGIGRQVDALWLLPDATVITPETTEYLLLMSLEYRIPIIAFSDKYLDLGAMMSIGIDAASIGRQAGRMALKILQGKNAADIAPEYVASPALEFNTMVARKLGVVLDTHGATAQARR